MNNKTYSVVRKDGGGLKLVLTEAGRERIQYRYDMYPDWTTWDILDELMESEAVNNGILFQHPFDNWSPTFVDQAQYTPDMDTIDPTLPPVYWYDDLYMVRDIVADLMKFGEVNLKQKYESQAYSLGYDYGEEDTYTLAGAKNAIGNSIERWPSDFEGWDWDDFKRGYHAGAKVAPEE